MFLLGRERGISSTCWLESKFRKFKSHTLWTKPVEVTYPSVKPLQLVLGHVHFRHAPRSWGISKLSFLTMEPAKAL